jgi:hypothetical protein
LRSVVALLLEHPQLPADGVDELQARRAARRVHSLLGD